MTRLRLLILVGLALSLSGVWRTASAQRLTFEVASIKRNTSADPAGSVRIEAGHLVVTNITLAGLVRYAHGTQRWEMVRGGDLPSWMETDRWDIQAKARPNASATEVSEMFRTLLADRFRLVTRRESREIPVYELVRARADGRLGPQLRPSTADCTAAPRSCDLIDTRGNITMTGREWATFPRSLSLPAGRFIVDRTAITGPVDLQLVWTPDQPGGAPTDSPSLYTALEEQLGLRLEPSHAPVNVLVIYSAERPQED